jgi:hypothetical protein
MINIRDVLKEKQNVERDRTKIFMTFLNRCIERIHKTVKTKPEITFITFSVPPIVFGLPLYDVRECIKFITAEFEKNGFEVRNLGSNTLLISWDKPPQTQDKKISNYKPVTSYKPMGGLSYNNSLFDSIENRQIRFR